MPRIGLMFIGTLMMVLVVLGCKKSDSSKNEISPAPSAGATTEAPAVSASLSAGGSPEKAFGLWEQGKQREAADELVQVNWSRPNLFSTTSPLLLNESQIPATPEPRRSQLIGQAMTALKPVRALCRYLMDASPKSIMEKKQYELSERQLQAVRGCGQALNRPGGLKITCLIGLAIQKAALARLVTLYSSNDQAKVPGIQAELNRLSNK